MMRIIANDKTKDFTIVGLNALDCVLIQSGLTGLLRHGNDTKRINDLIDLCDPAIEMILDEVTDSVVEELFAEGDADEPIGFYPHQSEADLEIEIDMDPEGIYDTEGPDDDGPIEIEYRDP